MNILLLSNWAPGYYNFFNALVKKLAAEGHNVVVAVDSEFSREENQLGSLGFKTYEFSSFFRDSTINKELLDKYSKFNLNSALLSDFERAEVYGLWKKNKPYFYDQLKSALLEFYEKIFIDNDIDVVLYENVSNTFSHFAFFVSQEKNARYVGLGMSRLPGRFFVSNDPLRDYEKVQDVFTKIQTGEIVPEYAVREWAENYLDNLENIVPDYMKVNNLEKVGLAKKYASIKKVKQLFRAIKYAAGDCSFSFQVGNPFVHVTNAVKRNFFRRLKVNFIGGFYKNPEEGDQYLLYPLHYHPEASTSILSGAYLNEYEVVRNIAFNLPQGVCLYVKDHMSAYGYPTIDFYRRIAALPGVKLIKPSAPTKQLIKKSNGVVTLTSTVGYEAALLNKTVYLLGKVFYQFHENVIRIENPIRIFYDLQVKSESADRRYNIDFICSYYIATEKGVLNLLANQEVAAVIVESNYSTLKTIILGAPQELE